MPAKYSDAIEIVLIAAFGSLLSIGVTGYVFGINNNLFHLPIIVELYNEPQYQADEFIQSLRYFAAGPWLVLAGAGRLFETYWLFFALLYFSRLISFIGLLT